MLNRMISQMDKSYAEYKASLGKEALMPPSSREDFDACSAKYVRKALKYIPKDKVNQEKYIADMLNVCSTCATQGEVRDTVKKLRKKPMSGWICYLKTCAKEEANMSYMDCMKDASRKEKLYNTNKLEWKQEALNGCPRGV